MVQRVYRLKEAGPQRRQAVECLQDANQLLETVWAVSPPDRKGLAQAIDLYSQAIDIDETFIEPYLALAYLTWRCGSLKDAARLVKTALQVEPNHPKAQSFSERLKMELAREEISSQVGKAAGKALGNMDENEKPNLKNKLSNALGKVSVKPLPNMGGDFFAELTQLKQKKKPSPKFEPAPQSTVEEPIDWDALYDQVELALQKQTSRLHEFMDKVQLTKDPEQMEQLEIKREAFLKNRDYLSTRMATLKNEFMMDDMNDLMASFDAGIQRFEGLLDSHEEWVALADILDGGISMTEDLIGRVKRKKEPDQAALNELDEALEAMYADCDQIADKIEDMASRWKLDPDVLAIYEQLAQNVQLLDELARQFRS